MTRKVRIPRNFYRLFEMLRSESDRAAGILAVSHLEAVLEDVLCSWLVSDERTEPWFDGAGNGFLGTFGAKCHLVYLLGLVGPEGHDDLKLLGRIRNRFAHHVLDSENFDVSAIKDLVHNLSAVKRWLRTRPTNTRQPATRTLFLVTVRIWIRRLAEMRRLPRDPEQVRRQVAAMLVDGSDGTLLAELDWEPDA